MVNVSSMCKEQARQHLLILGEEAHSSWTSLEIKSRIKELTVRDHKKGLGVNSNSSKAQMEQMCRLKGLSVTSNDTKGSLLRKLRGAQEYEVEGSEETLVGFGKHASLRYKEVPQSYLTWAIETFQEGGQAECCGQLCRLAKWAMVQRGTTAENREERPVPQATASSVASSAGGQMRARKATKRAGASPSKETAQEPEVASQELERKMEFMMGQVMAGMQMMHNRLISLEATQQAPKNTEENKSLETTPSQDSFKLVYTNPECQSESTQGCAWPMQDKKPGPVECRDHA